jgi:hypothetical protein
MRRFYIFKILIVIMQFPVFVGVALAGGTAQLIIRSYDPFLVFYAKNGEQRPVFVPKHVVKEVQGMYGQIDLVDLDEDGVKEIVASFVGEYAAINRCSKVYRYSVRKNTLSELKFNGGLLCGYRKEDGFVVSSYKDAGVWVEDVFRMVSGVPVIKYRDSCIGCGEISRVSYDDHGGSTKYLVLDSQRLKDRGSLYFDIFSSRAVIFERPDSVSVTKKYLVRGDRVLATAFDYFDNQIWIGFRFVGRVVAEGWIKCVDVVGCKGLVPVYKGE